MNPETSVPHWYFSLEKGTLTYESILATSPPYCLIDVTPLFYVSCQLCCGILLVIEFIDSQSVKWQGEDMFRG